MGLDVFLGQSRSLLLIVSVSLDPVLCPVVNWMLRPLIDMGSALSRPCSLVDGDGGSGCEVLDAPHQPWLAVLDGCEGDGEHGCEA